MNMRIKIGSKGENGIDNNITHTTIILPTLQNICTVVSLGVPRSEIESKTSPFFRKPSLRLWNETYDFALLAPLFQIQISISPAGLSSLVALPTVVI